MPGALLDGDFAIYQMLQDEIAEFELHAGYQSTAVDKAVRHGLHQGHIDFTLRGYSNILQKLPKFHVHNIFIHDAFPLSINACSVIMHRQQQPHPPAITDRA